MYPISMQYFSVFSVCSAYSNTRGEEQKVISYSYFNDDHAKFLVKNAQTIQDLYPGYIMRIYHNFTENRQLCELFCQNDHIDLCNVRILGKKEKIAKITNA